MNSQKYSIVSDRNLSSWSSQNEMQVGFHDARVGSLDFCGEHLVGAHVFGCSADTQYSFLWISIIGYVNSNS